MRISAPRTLARAIVLDDDPRIRSAIRSRLEIDGFCVSTVETAIEALDIFRDQANTPIIFINLMSPSGEGWKLHEQLAGDQTPLVALTAEGYLPFGDSIPACINMEKIMNGVERAKEIGRKRARAA